VSEIVGCLAEHNVCRGPKGPTLAGSLKLNSEPD